MPAHAARRRPGPDGAPAMLGVMGGGQLARMFVHAAQAMGYAHGGARPRCRQPGRAGVAPACADGLRRCAGPGAAGTALRRHHHRVRERAGAIAGLRWRHCGRWRRAPQAVAICQQRAAEKAHFQRCGVPCAPLCAWSTSADRPGAAGRGAVSRHPEDHPARLRRQGPGRRGRAPRRWPAPGTRCGACPACWKSAWPLRHEISVIVARAATANGCTCRCSRTCTATASSP